MIIWGVQHTSIGASSFEEKCVWSESAYVIFWIEEDPYDIYNHIIIIIVVALIK